MQIFTGIIEKGTRRASQLGFPTINTPLVEKDVSGIYAGRVIISGKTYKAAVFADTKRHLLEAHLIDFHSGDLYGKGLTVELVKKIRENEMFDSDEELRKAIANDVEKARTLI